MSILTLPLPPTMNKYWRAVGRGKVLVSAEGRAYQNRCQLVALAHRVTSIKSGPVFVGMRVYFPTEAGDLDNRIKPALDAMQGVCYANDRQVTKLCAERFTDRLSPRMEVEIRPAA